MAKHLKCDRCTSKLGREAISTSKGNLFCSITCHDKYELEKKLNEAMVLKKPPEGRPDYSEFKFRPHPYHIGMSHDELTEALAGKVYVTTESPDVEFNEPSHYHEHEIDTIEFLKRGFPPQVLTGFLIGNVIKYTQRYQYKNGEEDLMKIVDYAKRLHEWHKETHTF